MPGAVRERNPELCLTYSHTVVAAMPHLQTQVSLCFPETGTINPKKDSEVHSLIV